MSLHSLLLVVYAYKQGRCTSRTSPPVPGPARPHHNVVPTMERIMNTRYSSSRTPLDSLLGGILIASYTVLPLWLAVASYLDGGAV
jgi:hypothetical protein